MLFILKVAAQSESNPETTPKADKFRSKNSVYYSPIKTWPYLNLGLKFHVILSTLLLLFFNAEKLHC
uniref:Ovule protein n=1 Tax=Acrobeloides nanus TaxID=290746 RepID=A0A914DT32_9BILA